jgi:branched-chain amino acid transport system substrate-binding protein
MKRSALATVLLTATMVATSSCGLTKGAVDKGSGQGVTDTQIKIGTTNPLTGPVAASCKPVSDGALAWFDYVNNHGGINGRKIVDQVLDDAFTAPEALSNARQFVSDGVLAVFGGCGSVQPPAILPELAKNGIPYLFPYASAPALEASGYGRLFLIFPSYGHQLAGPIKTAMHELGPGSVWFANAQIPGSDQTERQVRQAVQDAGGTYLGGETTIVGTSDYTPLVLKMKAAHPDYVVLSQGAPDAARIVQTMAAQNALPTKRILGQANLATAPFVGSVGGIASGRVLTVSPVELATSQAAASCRQAFAKASPPLTAEGYSLFGCGTAQIMTEALKEAGKNLTRERLVQVLRSWQQKTASPIFPAVTFGASGNLGVTRMILVEIQNGQLAGKGELEVVP